MPFVEAQPIPPKKLSGMEITSAHGQLITRNVSALIIHVCNAAGLPIIMLKIGGMRARASAL